MRASSSVSGGTSSRTVATRAECSEAAAANLPWLFSENSLSGPAILDPGAHQPPVEFWRGVRPRKAANSRPLAKALASWIVALIADAVTGPTPGMVINRLAVSSALTDAASSLSIARLRELRKPSGRRPFGLRRCPHTQLRPCRHPWASPGAGPQFRNSGRRTVRAQSRGGQRRLGEVTGGP